MDFEDFKMSAADLWYWLRIREIVTDDGPADREHERDRLLGWIDQNLNEKVAIMTEAGARPAPPPGFTRLPTADGVAQPRAMAELPVPRGAHRRRGCGMDDASSLVRSVFDRRLQGND